MSNNFDLRKFLAENKLTQTAKTINENFPSQAEATIKESEGYVEVMGEDFDEAVDQIVFAWEQWKNGPATEPEDIEPAREDVVSYIRSLLK